MPRRSLVAIQRELQEIAELLQEHPDGLSRQQISQEYQKKHHKKISSRTMQRRVEQLVSRQKIVAEGETTATKYRPAIAGRTPQELETNQVPLSVKGAQVQQSIRKPIIERAPVGYDREWLYGYQPGKTWYLPKPIRARLHVVGRTPDESRPAGTFAREILGRLLIDLAWASSRLEGNTYTRLDTQNLLEFGQRAEGKDLEEAQMILNHKAAIEYLVSGDERLGFNRPTLFTIHAALSENLIGDSADEGRLRERAVNITGTTYTPPGIPQVIRECFDQILATASQITDPFERSFFAMVHIPYLQPFADVNKRTSRLAANIPLIEANLCPLSFIDIPEQAYIDGILGVYEQKRVELLRDVFVFAYERSCAQYRVVRDSIAHPDPIRMRYRAELAKVVAETVRSGEPPSLMLLRKRGEDLGVPEQDADDFAQQSLQLLVNLNEGSAGRYHILQTEFNDWKARFSSSQQFS